MEMTEEQFKNLVYSDFFKKDELSNKPDLNCEIDYKEINSLMAKCIKERNSPSEKNEEFRKALLDAENALRKLKAFY